MPATLLDLARLRGVTRDYSRRCARQALAHPKATVMQRMEARLVIWGIL